MPRFRVYHLFLLTVVIAIGASAYNHYLANRALEWKPFESKALAAALNQHQTVVVRLTADWDTCGHRPNHAEILSNATFARFARNERVTTLHAHLTPSNSEIDALMQTINPISIPAIAVFSPYDRESPEIIDSMTISEEQLRQLIAHSRFPH